MAIVEEMFAISKKNGQLLQIKEEVDPYLLSIDPFARSYATGGQLFLFEKSRDLSTGHQIFLVRWSASDLLRKPSGMCAI
jgi:hypothetical protein